MSTPAKALLAIWHDVDPEAVDDYIAWHTFEHLPERIALPGFLRAHRLELESGPGQQFFCVIEVRDLTDFQGEDYLARLNSPTEWTRRMMPHYSKVHRSLCQLVCDKGRGVSPFTQCLRFNLMGQLPRKFTSMLETLTSDKAATRVRLAALNSAVSAQDTEEKRLRRGENQGGFDYLLLLDGHALPSLEAAVMKALAEIRPLVETVQRSLYRHSYFLSA
ncbi:DUF4286 family protein [Microvirga sp. VF16]|uniref:DUF4286 family protein n=1 Tax=Microvirga sp. VF16 TaxID=2807101 RepID=UPI00193CED6F|nr:DUF4286 family protein [Microvirga sp. VF16]QRM33178.1 hypothetical protein JO965_28265 [Microvirga sp. VF16]